MKNLNMFKKRSMSVHLAGLVLLACCSASAQTTAFSYQGSLKDNGSPANGAFQMQFKLFDSSAGGSQIGMTIADVPVTAVGGIFTTRLDFGANALSGANRFLEIAVRRNSGDAYTILNPREQIASAPYAVRTLSAASADVATNALNADVANNALSLGGQPASQYVQTTDPRLSDSRNPLPGSSAYIQNQTSSTQSGAGFNIAGTGTADTFDATSQFNIAGTRVLSIGGTRNTFAGVGAGQASTQSATPGTDNVFVGHNAGLTNVSNPFGVAGNFNSYVGSRAGESNALGRSNSFFGAGAGRLNAGNNNSIFGAGAGESSTTGSNNSIFGTSAGGGATTGNDNAFFGMQAGAGFTAFGDPPTPNTGSGNSYFGSSAGLKTSTGNNNSFFGVSAGFANRDGSGNVFLGASAGENNTVGVANTFVGTAAGLANVSGSSNTILGNYANSSGPGRVYETVIGAGAVGFGSNTIVLGTSNEWTYIPGALTVSRSIFSNRNDSSTALYGQTNSGNGVYGYSSSGTGVLGETAFGYGVIGRSNTGSGWAGWFTGSVTITGFLDLDTLGSGGGTPVCRNNTFVLSFCSSSRRYKSNILPLSAGLDLIHKLQPVSFDWKSDHSADVGLVAEEVAEVEPRLVTYNEKGDIEGVKYDRITVVLIKAIKEQQALIEAQNRKDKLRQEQIERQRAQIDALKKLVCSRNQQAEVCKENKQ
jgi:hypothetical protein